jgi:hypothetical protein
VLTEKNDKNKIKTKHFSKTQVHLTIGGFFGHIKVNKTSISNK